MEEALANGFLREERQTSINNLLAALNLISYGSRLVQIAHCLKARDRNKYRWQ